MSSDNINTHFSFNHSKLDNNKNSNVTKIIKFNKFYSQTLVDFIFCFFMFPQSDVQLRAAKLEFWF